MRVSGVLVTLFLALVLMLMWSGPASAGDPEIPGWYFDADGNSVEAPSLHPVALTLDDLRNASRVIGVAGGVEKAEAIRGAIAAGILDELAIDETLAEELLKE